MLADITKANMLDSASSDGMQVQNRWGRKKATREKKSDSQEPKTLSEGKTLRSLDNHIRGLEGMLGDEVPGL